MPIYDFQCKECKKVFEKLLLKPDIPPLLCPVCGSVHIEKLFSSSYMIKTEDSHSGTTCCGRSERCETPPCSSGESCCRG